MRGCEDGGSQIGSSDLASNLNLTGYRHMREPG
jgi:hypothetical protein